MFRIKKKIGNNIKTKQKIKEEKFAVVFKNVKKNFFRNNKQNIILNNVSFNIYKSKITSILGSSGAGKTTTAKIINGLENYTSGSVLINGVYLNKTSQSKIRKKTAFVFQNFNLFPHLSVLDNVIYTPIKAYRQKQNIVIMRAKKLLKQFNILNKIDCLPCELSGGQKQRVAIIRALMLEPEILIMDEPTASLDPELTNEVIEMIKTIKKTGITIIIITHDIIVAKKASDFILMLHGGKVMDFMKTDDFFDIKKKKSFYSQKFLKNCI